VAPEQIALGIVWYVCFLFSLTCHEAAHALVAARGGDLTASNAGQVTLNPAPHVRREPFGTVVVPLLSYALGGWMIGWASAPYDPAWQHRYPKRAAWMALAGPASNLLIVVVVGILIKVLIGMGVLVAPDFVSFAHLVEATGVEPGAGFQPLPTALSILFSLNLLLAVFNLMPVPPLDGATVIGLFMSDDASRKFTRLMAGGPLALAGILIAWKLLGWIFSPIFSLALGILYGGGTYR
jgi:Zn-dependent protease